MKTHFAWVALAATTIIGGSAVTQLAMAPMALAQTVPEGQSCGGLLCDMGVFGHKTEPKPAPAAAAPVVETHAKSPAAREETAESSETQPKKRTAQRKKRVAKVKPAPDVATETQAPSPPANRAAARVAPPQNLASPTIYAPPPATAGATPTFAATSTMAPAPVVVSAPPAAPRPAAAPARPSASESRPTAILDPFGQTPVNAPFRSLY